MNDNINEIKSDVLDETTGGCYLDCDYIHFEDISINPVATENGGYLCPFCNHSLSYEERICYRVRNVGIYGVKFHCNGCDRDFVRDGTTTPWHVISK